MSRLAHLRLFDRKKIGLWPFYGTYSATSSTFFISHMQLSNTKNCVNTLAVFNEKGMYVSANSHLLISPFGQRYGPVCYMSSSREPPDITKKQTYPDQDTESYAEKRLDKGGLETMMKLVKEKKSDFEAYTKQLTENSSGGRVSWVTPDIKETPALLAAPNKEEQKADDWNDILNRWYVKYQDFIGITDLKRAQDKVTELSEGLLGTQSRRRNLQSELEDLQEQLTLNHQRITKAELYSDQHYQLFDEARVMNTRLKDVRSEFENCEGLERDTFTQLSAAIRDCHERERTQAEQSKYWSIIASIVSAALASVITSVNNWVRIREIKDHVSVNNKALLEGYQKMHEDIVNIVSTGAAIGVTEEVRSPAVVAKDTVGAEVMTEVASSSTITPATSHVALDRQDLALLSNDFKEMLKEQVSVVLTNETKLFQETLKPHLDAIFANLGLILEGNSAIADIMLSSSNDGSAKELTMEEVNKMEVITPLLPGETSEKKEGKAVVVDYSYKTIASAMAVGAGIGTLATAFLLGSFGGGAAE